jgi:hypothetical protein
MNMESPTSRKEREKWGTLMNFCTLRYSPSEGQVGHPAD